MSAVIHGQSHKALKHLRKPTPALTVYWLYCSRMNNEGVAWTSLRRLADDTGWSINSLMSARRYLVKHKALEPVKNYVRPAWRKLPEAERKRKMQLDHNEYFRPTGHFVTDEGEVLPLLYYGGVEHPDEYTDVSICATSQNFQRGQIDTELNTSPQLNTSNDIAPSDDGAKGDDKSSNKPESPQARYMRLVFNPIFDALQESFWETDDDSDAYADDDKTNGGRIAKVAWWHCGKRYKGVRKIGNPATEETVQAHVDAIKAFAKWVKSKNITLHDVTKYVEWYGKWRTAVKGKTSRAQVAAQSIPSSFDNAPLTAEQLRVIRQRVSGRRQNEQRRLS